MTDSTLEEKHLDTGVGLLAVLGALDLSWAASNYLTFGISTFPRQEWLIEVLGSALFLLPVLNFWMKAHLAERTSAIRVLGFFLALHSAWDALHWTAHPILPTPIEPWIPRVCPFFDLSVGTYLLLRGR